MVKFLIGGSPCTHWSIAQSKARETEPEGLGWELFKNYLLAKERFRPDFFLYENNKSATQSIKNQISAELQQPLQYINSALVSAQKRERFYVHNIPNVLQPVDRGIILSDILQSGQAWQEKAYCLTANYYKGSSLEHTLQKHARTQIAEPVRIGTIESLAKNADFDSQQYRVYSPEGKSVTLCGNGGGVGAKTGLYAVPCGARQTGRRIGADGKRHDYDESIEHFQRIEINENPNKTNCLSTVQKDNLIIEYWDGKTYPVYEVRNGLVTIKGKTYPIRLPDNLYIIRKLTVTECCRLQTLPDNYCRAVSATQAYKGLGNGWTAEVIMHILKHANIPLNEEIVVLSMYDGIGTGRYCFDKLGYKNVKYYAYEIDKYATQISMSNYSDIIQCGDAFQFRNADWRIAI